MRTGLQVEGEVDLGGLFVFEGDFDHDCDALCVFDEFLEELSVLVVDEDGGYLHLVAVVVVSHYHHALVLLVVHYYRHLRPQSLRVQRLSHELTSAPRNQQKTVL